MAYTKYAADCGADACLVVTPYYNKPNISGLREHYKAINQVGLPIILYNIPGRTGINLSPKTLSLITSECENIRGLKAANGNLDEITEAALRFENSKQTVDILSGDDSLTLPIMSVGGTGVVSVISNLMPKVYTNFTHDIMFSNKREQIITTNKILFELCSNLLCVSPNPVPIKHLLNYTNVAVGRCRLPLGKLENEQIRKLDKCFLSTIKKLMDNGDDIDSHLKAII